MIGAFSLVRSGCAYPGIAASHKTFRSRIQRPIPAFPFAWVWFGLGRTRPTHEDLRMPFLIGTLAALVVGAATLGSVTAAVVAFVFATTAAYLYLPVLAPDFIGLWVIAMATLAIGGGVAFWTRRKENHSSRQFRAAVLTMAAAPALLVVLIVASFVSTASMFRAAAYASLIGTVETVPFTQAIQRLDTTGHPVASDKTVIDQASVRLVDADVAERRAQELLGRDPEYGGTYTLGTMQLTRRKGRLVFASPLEFTGLFRWRSSDGAPAYVWVDAHDARSAGLVKEADGKPLRLRCIDSAYFGDNLRRLVWDSAPDIATTDYSFEIGPKGRPYYAVTTYDHRVGFGGGNPNGIIVVDPQTCTTARHAMTDIPAWVNRVIPEDIAEAQAADWAALSAGWLNASPFGAHAGVKVPTPGVELVSTTATGDTSWYMGLATAGNPNGTTGFLLVDSRSKKATYFEQSGATETAARDAILGKIAEKRGWTVTLPILYNISDRATYLAMLKDGSGNYKGVGLMPVDDRNLVVVADDLTRGLMAYSQAIAGRASGSANPTEPQIVVDGVVARVATEVVDGNTVYWLTFKEKPGAVFSATSRLGPQVALTRPGDTLHVTAQGPEGGVLTVTAMDNPAVLPPAAK